MQYCNVCLDAFGYVLPDEIVHSDEIERELAPLYRRLGLEQGYLESVTGIRQRRFWPQGARPSQISAQSVAQALDAVGIDHKQIGALVHTSVWRDQLEPATACTVHSLLGLPQSCLIYDLSNACLGFLDGMVQVANMIELGQIRAGVVVATEGSRELVEPAIDQLRDDRSITVEDFRLACTSLTIGSASVACVLSHAELSPSGNRLLGGIVRSDTYGCNLCVAGEAPHISGRLSLQLRTDTEGLMLRAVRAGMQSIDGFKREIAWTDGAGLKPFTHQVSRDFGRLMMRSMKLPDAYSTVEYLGNTISAALPITVAIAIDEGYLVPADRLALLGFGSGLNLLFLGVDWQRSLAAQCRRDASSRPDFAAIDP